MTAPKPTHTVLVVDDQELNRIFLRELLTAEAFRVLEAVDGTAALKAVQTEKIDVVLLDLMMPDLDGFQVCRRIRQDLGRLDLPIVVVTALADRTSRVRAKELGADDFLTKPIDGFELLTRLENLVKVREYHRFKDVMHQERLARLQERIPTPAGGIRASRVADFNELGEALEAIERHGGPSESLQLARKALERLRRTA
jgi:DNA-binding response OmpR family regulator